MAKLPKSIIRKYGITKKAWRVYRGRKSTTKKVKKRGIKTMARRRKRTVRARSRRRKYGGSVKLIQPDAMIYGAGRGFLSGLVAPLTNMIPGGFITDEIAMGIANYFIAKNTSGLIKRAALKGLAIENSNFASSLVGGGLSLGGGQAQTTQLLG